MERVSARVAPVAIKIVFGQRRTRAAQFVQLVGRQYRNLGGQDFSLSHRGGRCRHGVPRWSFENGIDGVPDSIRYPGTELIHRR
jgi:hypothetical protein